MAASSPLCRGRRTGVLTFHRCINYGSYWQARCLAEGLRDRGHDVVILDHESPRVAQAELRCALEPVLPTPVPPRDRLLYALKTLSFYRAFQRLPLSRPFSLEAPTGLDALDRVVVGSDEVWNLCHPWYGGCSLFFGEDLPTRRLLSYAASFGSYEGGLPEPWAERLRHFDRISVRDGNSREIIRQGVGVEPELVLDPCLQFPVRAEGPAIGPRRPYVAVYGHNFTPEFQSAVRDWSESRCIPLVSIGYRNDWVDRHWITAGPHQFAHFMRRAACVVTNFFHGCVFALRFGRPFACEATPYRSVKVRSLMGTLGGERRLVGSDVSAETLSPLLERPLEPAIRERIAELRARSNGYLDRALA
jgi:hypothetical protein